MAKGRGKKVPEISQTSGGSIVENQDRTAPRGKDGLDLQDHSVEENKTTAKDPRTRTQTRGPRGLVPARIKKKKQQGGKENRVGTQRKGRNALPKSKKFQLRENPAMVS